MGEKLKLAGNWSSGRNKITVNLSVILFKEEGTVIVFCPALDIYGYGMNEEEAKNSFDTALDEYFRYTINKNTLHDDLTSRGWKVHGSKTKKSRLDPPTMLELLNSNADFGDIFNTHEFQKLNRMVEIPC
ncbi:MAG: hypothetical protein RBS07_18460 [Lentimicrobium sp.]|jgi:hypothetical protein|nr:hypothetical protein [Lentimicrobium sp.]